MTALADPPEVEPVTDQASDAPAADGWRRDKKGRDYVPARGRSGTVYREGSETVEQAHQRDAEGPRQRGPKRRTGPATNTVPKSAAPRQPSLQEIEAALGELLRAPAMMAVMTGDQWAADHCARVGPILARNLCKAAETDPWLRRKLEAVVLGNEALMMRLMMLVPVLTALAAYTVPLIIYFLDPGFIPGSAREAYAVPRRPARTERMGMFDLEGEDAAATAAETAESTETA